MGRHSAPGSDEEELSAVDLTSPPLESLIPWGRHEIVDAATINDTTPLDTAAPVEATPLERPPAAPSPSGTPASSGPPSSAGTRGDLQLLRESHSLRVRCAAAVLVPFALYTVILVVLGRTDVYLIWLWVPTVLAGVCVGTFLDIAHRRRTAAPAPKPAESVPRPADSVPRPAESVDDD